jgi:chromosome segregation ATPase
MFVHVEADQEGDMAAERANQERAFPWERREDPRARGNDEVSETAGSRGLRVVSPAAALDERRGLYSNLPGLLREASEAIKNAEARALSIEDKMAEALSDAESRVEEAQARAKTAEELVQSLEKRIQAAEGRAKAAEALAQSLEKRAKDAIKQAEMRIEEAESRARSAERRAEAAEDIATAARSWVERVRAAMDEPL